LKITSNADDPASFQAIVRCVFSHMGTGDYTQCIYIDGTANQRVGGQGVRDLSMHETLLFQGNAGTETFRCINLVNGLFTACWSNGSITIFGGGTPLTNSTDGVYEFVCLSNVFVSNVNTITLYGSFGSLILGS
jgi:hypothetical protein